MVCCTYVHLYAGSVFTALGCTVMTYMGLVLEQFKLFRCLLTGACTMPCVAQVKEAGMSVSEKDNDGATPLHFASARGELITLSIELSSPLHI